MTERERERETARAREPLFCVRNTPNAVVVTTSKLRPLLQGFYSRSQKQQQFQHFFASEERCSRCPRQALAFRKQQKSAQCHRFSLRCPFSPTLTSSTDRRNNIQWKEVGSLDNCLISQESGLHNAAHSLQDTIRQGCQQHEKKSAGNQYHSNNIVRNNKSRTLRWKGYVARMEEIKNAANFNRETRRKLVTFTFLLPTALSGKTQESPRVYFLYFQFQVR